MTYLPLILIDSGVLTAYLSLIAISERWNIGAIATLDSDFDIYRRYCKQPFERAFMPK